MFHLSRKIPPLADDVRFAQAFLRAGIDAEITRFTAVGVYFYSGHSASFVTYLNCMSFLNRGAIPFLYYLLE